MKLYEKITYGGVIAAVGGVAVHILSDMFFTSNKIGMALLIIGMCGIAAGKMLGDLEK